jgi:hypothetical protein
VKNREHIAFRFAVVIVQIVVFWVVTMLNPEMEAPCSSEASVSIYKTTWCHNPEYHILKMVNILYRIDNEYRQNKKHVLSLYSNRKMWVWETRR